MKTIIAVSIVILVFLCSCSKEDKNQEMTVNVRSDLTSVMISFFRNSQIVYDSIRLHQTYSIVYENENPEVNFKIVTTDTSAENMDTGNVIIEWHYGANFIQETLHFDSLTTQLKSSYTTK